MQEQASERMGKKNVVFTKDGVKVGVKQVQNEKYVDKTQSYVVKAWNLAQEEDAYVNFPHAMTSALCVKCSSLLTVII